MVPKKKVIGLIKLRIQAGSVSPAPPIGPALSQHGVNITGFCRVCNAQTRSVRGSIVPVEITIYGDRSFDFVLETSPTSEVIRKAAGIQKGSDIPNTVKVADLTWDQVVKITEEKMKDLNANDIKAAKKVIVDIARFMGVTVG